MTRDEALKVLEGLEAVEAKASEGPFLVKSMYQVVAKDDGGMRVGSWPHIGNAARPEDAEFFVAARNAFPVLLSIVRRVVERHRPDKGAADCYVCDPAEGWPCPTIEAVLEELSKLGEGR